MKWENRDINVVERASIPKFGKLDDLVTPFRLLKLFFDNVLVDLIVGYSHRETVDISFEIANEKNRLFLIVLPLRGYHMLQRTSGKKSSVTLTVAGYDDSRAVYIAFSESCEPNRFVCCWNKIERKYIQEQQPNQFHSYNQNMGFVNRMVQNVAKYRAGIRMKK